LDNLINTIMSCRISLGWAWAPVSSTVHVNGVWPVTLLVILNCGSTLLTFERRETSGGSKVQKLGEDSSRFLLCLVIVAWRDR
jgi:hypothetical protein